MAKLIINRDRNLLSRSDITKNHPILIQFLDETPNLDSRKLNTLGDDAVRFFDDIFPKVNKEAINEWVIDEKSVDYRPGEKNSCELCGQPIIKICVIENKFTNTRMIIGSECVLHFGINSDFNMEELLAEKKRIYMLEQLNSIYPGIERIIDRWDSFIDEQEILIKRDIKINYIELGLKARNIFEKYLDEKTSNITRKKLVIEIKHIFNSRDEEVDKIIKYVNKNKADTLIPDRNLVKRLSTSGQRDIVEMIEEDGRIRHRTLFRIKDEIYSNSLIKVLNSKFRTLGCEIKEVVYVGNELGYRFVYSKKANIKLFCPHQELFFNFYNFITGDRGDDIDLRGLINISRFYDWVSIETGLFEHFKLVKEYGIELDDDDIYFEYGDMYVFNRKQNIYYKLDILRISKDFFIDFFFQDPSTKQRFYKYIMRNEKRPISKKDMIYIRKSRDDSGKQLKQREFI